MCVVSMVIDHQRDNWQRKWPEILNPSYIPPANLPTQEEIDEFRRLLERAREYDRRNNEPDCEMDDKKRILKEMADKLGVDISFIEV